MRQHPLPVLACSHFPSFLARGKQGLEEWIVEQEEGLRTVPGLESKCKFQGFSFKALHRTLQDIRIDRLNQTWNRNSPYFLHGTPVCLNVEQSLQMSASFRPYNWSTTSPTSLIDWELIGGPTLTENEKLCFFLVSKVIVVWGRLS